MTPTTLIFPATGMASVKDALLFAGVRSRTTLIKMERDGRFPQRIDRGAGRVGYKWADLHAWLNTLTSVEGGAV